MVPQIIEGNLRRVILELDLGLPPSAIAVRPCSHAKFGDYQCHSVMEGARRLGKDPRGLARAVAEKLSLGDLCETPEVVGPGFINFRVRRDALERLASEALSSRHLFFRPCRVPRTIVIDFSSPNVAKPMHVGHIRSTILGDCLARILRYLGHHVITDNHIGDWGTQFGKLLAGWKTQRDERALRTDGASELARLYQRVNRRCEENRDALREARRELVKLQAGDSENLEIWNQMRDLSRRQFDRIYQRLQVSFDFALGESFYNPRLSSVVKRLHEAGIAQASEGAQVVFFQEPALKNHPAVIQKSDGAANYLTTDLATIEYRLDVWKADEIIYVTDGRQQLHFQQLFSIFKRWRPEAKVKLVHTWFGSILGRDGKPFKTRSGETIRLSDLLDEAEERAFRIVSEKNPSLDEATRRDIGRKVGLGAVKYADLLPNRQSDYIFDWDKLLSLQGNTAPYLQYACTRIRSIFRRGGAELGAPPSSGKSIRLGADSERALVRHLIDFGYTLDSVMADHRPNYLCNYLYDLAGAFSAFYEECPVLKADASLRESRLNLCGLTAAVLGKGLQLIGIETPEVM